MSYGKLTGSRWEWVKKYWFAVKQSRSFFCSSNSLKLLFLTHLAQCKKTKLKKINQEGATVTIQRSHFNYFTILVFCSIFQVHNFKERRVKVLLHDTKPCIEDESVCCETLLCASLWPHLIFLLTVHMRCHPALEILCYHSRISFYLDSFKHITSNLKNRALVIRPSTSSATQKWMSLFNPWDLWNMLQTVLTKFIYTDTLCHYG